jgi:hypothetical protein
MPSDRQATAAAIALETEKIAGNLQLDARDLAVATSMNLLESG